MEAYANENNHDVMKFVPFAVECFGGTGSQAERFLNTLSVYATWKWYGGDGRIQQFRTSF